jgi:hypothetical protein
MKAIDRVMAAYAKVHKVTDEQTELVRGELSRFIDQLLYGRQPEGAENQRTPKELNRTTRNRGALSVLCHSRTHTQLVSVLAQNLDASPTGTHVVRPTYRG